MSKNEQERENKLSVVIEIGLPGQTVLPASMSECSVMISQQSAQVNDNQLTDKSESKRELLEFIRTEPVSSDQYLEASNTDDSDD